MIILLLSTVFIIFFMLNTPSAIPETAESLRSFLFVVLPSIFPLCVLSDWLVKTGAFNYPGKLFAPIMKPLFRLSGICTLPVIIGLVGSYPSSAKTTATLYHSKQITLNEAIVLTTFTNHAGPTFIISVIGIGFLSSPLLGFVIWICQIFSGLILGIIFSRILIRKRGVEKPMHIASYPFTKSIRLLSSSIADAAHTMVTVGGTILFFTALSASLEYINIPFIHTFTGISRMFLEMTSGCQAVNIFTYNGLSNTFLMIFRCCLYAGVVSWGGVSVHLQIIHILSQCGIPCKYYLISKTFHTILAMLLTFIVIICIF